MNATTTAPVSIDYANGSDNTIRPTSLTYPNGRVLGYQYDASFSQVTAISAGTSLLDPQLAQYQYLGLATPVVVGYPEPGLTYSLLGTSGPYSGLDRFGRIVDASWGSAARIQYGYNRASSRIWRKDPVAAANSAQYDELYAYDGLQRLSDMQRGTLNGTQTGLTSETFAQCWTLDALGNWGQMREASTGGAWTLEQERTANAVNEITGISATTGPTWVTPVYDPAGNMTVIPQPKDPTKHFTATYDAWNRLVRLTKPAEPPSSSSSSSSSSSTGGLSSSSGDTSSSTSGGFTFETSSSTSGTSSSSSSTSSSSATPVEILVAEYDYDARRFRIRERTYTDGVISETRDVYFTESWQAIEERIPPQTFPWAERQYVWGLRYIDDCVLRDKLPFPGTGDPQRLYALQDANWNVIAITDDEGAVQERYAYSAYGEPKFLQPDFTTQSASLFGWRTLYAGYGFDLPTLLFAVRHRMYHAGLGTWLNRDPIGYARGMNLYQYVLSASLTVTDPYGLADSTWHHIFSQAGKLQNKLLQLCGFEKLSDVKKFIDRFTVQAPEKGMPRGSMHDFLQYRLKGGMWNKMVEGIYGAAESCCDALKGIRDLHQRASEEYAKSLNPNARGPFPPLPLGQYKTEVCDWAGNQALDRIVKDTCDNQSPQPVDVPVEAPVPQPVPAPDARRTPLPAPPSHSPAVPGLKEIGWWATLAAAGATFAEGAKVAGSAITSRLGTLGGMIMGPYYGPGGPNDPRNWKPGDPPPLY